MVGKWDERFMSIAETVALWSKDPRTKVGALLVSPDRREWAAGWNGFPHGVLEFPNRWKRPTKYHFSCHAEQNAIDNARRNLDGWTLYVTLFPCETCAKSIIQNGVKRVVYKEEPREDTMCSHDYTLTMFEESGITIERI